MTAPAKFEILRKIEEMLNGLDLCILTKANSFLLSGAIDLKQYKNDCRLPKIILTACLEHYADQYRPKDEKGRKEVKNLSHF